MKLLTAALSLHRGTHFIAVISTLLLLAFAPSAQGHEVMPSIADMTVIDGTLEFEVQANLEGFVAGIDLSEVDDTGDAAEAETYDALRAMTPIDLEQRFRAFWPSLAGQIVIRTEKGDLKPDLTDVQVPEVGNPEVVRPSVFRFRADLPDGVTVVQTGWSAQLGALVLRQQGVEKPYDGYLDPGSISPPIQLAGGDQATPWQAFRDYIPIGFQHIVPLGLDHILFVLGLFFLTARLRPLLWQVTAFTLAHTITLAMGALGYVSVPGSIVEPIIAASIVYVAVENILTDGLSRWRPLVVFGFGLLHGLGFASVLEEFGVPESNFIAALLGFNVGVELGQLAVILAAFLLVGLWFRNMPWYRAVIAIPASGAIGLMAAWWFVERAFL
ncbi:MAG: HupE/UreJ family protein [Allorhizobium sp.]